VLTVLCVRGLESAISCSKIEIPLVLSLSLCLCLSLCLSVSAQASDRECQWVIRIAVLLVGLAGMGLAFIENSVFTLWLVSSDLIYCVIFPQLICVLYCPFANGYGATAGYVLALVLRGLSGEPLLHVAPVLLFPGWRRDPETGAVSQYFPFRTLIMLLSMLAVPSASLLSRLAFTHRLLPASWDVLGVLNQQQHQQQEGEEGEEGEEVTGEEDGDDEEGEKLATVKEKLLAISSTSSQKVAGGEAASC